MKKLTVLKVPNSLTVWKPILALLFILHCNWLYSQNAGSYKVYALKFAEKGAMPISFLVLNGPEKDSVNLVFMTWLIKSDKGKNILVDAGFLRDVDEAKDFGVKNYIRPDSLLPELGIAAKDITDIILTHPHWDHMDAIGLFPNAQVYIQKQDYNYFVGDAWQKEGNHGGFNSRDVSYLVKLNLLGKLTLVDGDDKEIFPGIKVYTGSRHTFNSQYVLVQNWRRQDRYCFRQHLDRLQPKPSSTATVLRDVGCGGIC